MLPFSINVASQALYRWLCRSKAETIGCQKHGISRAAEIRIGLMPGMFDNLD
jgi:hypothetical protein